MNIHQAFPSRFIKAAQITDPVDVTIRCVVMEEVGDGEKAVVYFEGKAAGLVMNKTQGMAIAAIHGEELEAWAGRVIRMGPGKTHYAGKMVPTVVIEKAPEIANDPPAPGGDDAIPF